MNIDALSGRDLDAAIARHVFGLTVEERRNSRTGEMDAVYQVGQDANAWVRLPFYSSTMGASITVEIALQDRGWRYDRPLGKQEGEVRVILEHADGRTVEAFGPVNEAICRAALKAVQQA